LHLLFDILTDGSDILDQLNISSLRKNILILSAKQRGSAIYILIAFA